MRGGGRRGGGRGGGGGGGGGGAVPVWAPGPPQGDKDCGSPPAPWGPANHEGEHSHIPSVDEAAPATESSDTPSQRTVL